MRMPRERSRPTRSSRSRCNLVSCSSSRAVWMETIRWGPCDRIEAGSGVLGGRASVGIRHLRDTEPELPFGLLDPALEVADRVHLAQVDANGDEGLGDLRRQSRDD